jgi:Leucine-rich repeat (LRR) protein
LDNNKLTDVPAWIGGLPLLQSLFLHSNNISRVSQQLQSFWANKSASLVVTMENNPL